MSTPATQRVVVLTGASSGVGKAAAAMFVADGWHVIGTGRDPARSATAIAEVTAAAAKGGRFDMLTGDFCEMQDVVRIATEVRALTGRVDALINNAGGWRDGKYASSAGIEATMAANHYASFLLTRELLPLLRATAASSPPGTARVIAVSSSGHAHCPAMRWDDLDWHEGFAAGGIYCQAKLANMLFARELARREGDAGVISQAMHPGVVASNFGNHGDEGMKNFMNTRLDADPPEKPARTLYWMATAPEAGNPPGRYFHDCAEVPAAAHALDDKAAARLWQATEERLAGLGY